MHILCGIWDEIIVRSNRRARMKLGAVMSFFTSAWWRPARVSFKKHEARVMGLICVLRESMLWLGNAYRATSVLSFIRQPDICYAIML